MTLRKIRSMTVNERSREPFPDGLARTALRRAIFLEPFGRSPCWAVDSAPNAPNNRTAAGQSIAFVEVL